MRNNPADPHYLRDFFENAPVGFHSFGPDRIIIDMNRTELEMLGYSREEVVGKKRWVDFIDPVQVPLFEKHWKDIHVLGEARNLHYTLICRDGQRRRVLLNASARFDSRGKLVNTRGSVVDITERYELARHLAESQSKLSRHKQALQKNNSILMGWMDQLEEEKQKYSENIQRNMEQTIFPLVEKLKRRGSSNDRRHLEMLERSLQELASGFAVKLMEKKWRLSLREIEICKMLKGGLKTKEIADLLSTSERTIEHHRNHIRKKLGISQSTQDLMAYLRNFAL